MKIKILLTIIWLFVSPFIWAQENKKDLKIGVVLSGGGAKGYAHVGALKALEESGVKIDYIGGTSMGAIVGALYASGYNADQLKEIINQLDLNSIIFDGENREKTPFFSKMHEEKYIFSLEFEDLKLRLPKSIARGQGPVNVLSDYLSHVHNIKDFNQLSIPFMCVATDIETGKQKVFRSGFLPEIIMASGAYPTLFNPIEIDDRYYVDGGVKNNYPAQEVLDMGADFLIGVDVGAGLKDYEDITNATTIIEQIVSFGIEEKTEEQRKLIDLAIVPNVKEISVTNFELKDSIMQEGYKAALLLKPKFDSLRKVQGYFYKNPMLKKDSIFTVKDINIKGLEQYSRGYVLGKLGIEPNQQLSYAYVIEGIRSLTATENFNKIKHRLSYNDDGTRNLNLEIEEKKNKFYLKFGLHYDELFKSSLLLNFTAKNLLTINSTLSVDAIMGDHPRFNVNYFVDNGIRPSFGFNSSYYKFDIEDLEVLNPQNINVTYNYKLQNFVNQLYTQSTLAEKYAVGLGMEYNYLKIYTNNLSSLDPYQTIQNASFLIPYAFVRADNRDNSFFPTKGLYLNSEFKYFLHSNAQDFDIASLLKADVQYNHNVFKNFTLQASSTLGMSFIQELPKGYNFLIGGQNHHRLINSYNFYGFPFGSYQGDNLIKVGAAAQYSINKKHFIKYDFNAASLSEDFFLKHPLSFEHIGHGLTYGYLSPLGPLQGSISYSPSHKEMITYIALGYWF